MKRIINNGRRRLGISGRPAIILNPNESREIDDYQLDEIRKNRTVANWIEAGILTVSDGDEKIEATATVKPKKATIVHSKSIRPGAPRDERQAEPLPDGIEGEGIETHHLGGGWYQVYVNGFKVTDRNVRKDEAKEIASEYE